MTTATPYLLPRPTLPPPTPPATRAHLAQLVAAAQDRHARRVS